MAIVQAEALVTVTFWVCDLCVRSAEFIPGTGSPLSAEYFIDRLHWLAFDNGTIACDRCRPLHLVESGGNHERNLFCL